VVVTPHLGASTAEAQDRAGIDTAEAVAAALAGELVPSAVNVDLGREVSDEVRAFVPLAEQLGRAFVGLSGGMTGRVVLRAEGRLAGHELRPLELALLKGALSGFTAEPVSYVNARALAEERGMEIEVQSSEESAEYVSLLRVSGEDGTSFAGTIARKGPTMVEILGNDVELPFSPHVLIVRNVDVPGVIGRVGTYLGGLGINISNMVVGQSRITGQPAMMGMNLDRALTPEQVDGVRSLEGIEEARYLDLG
jgi:D-3-phosphoglycerate dehydrogenase